MIATDPASRVTVDNPRRYLRSPTGVLHLRSASGVIEEDGLSSSRARCGWESDHDAIAETVGADDKVCKRCQVIEP